MPMPQIFGFGTRRLSETNTNIYALPETTNNVIGNYALKI